MDYVFNNIQPLRQIVFSLDLDLWSRDAYSDFESRFGISWGYQYDKSHGFWAAEALPAQWEQYLEMGSLDRSPMRTHYSSTGFVPIASNSLRFPADITVLHEWHSQPEQYFRAVANMDTLLSLFGSHNIPALGVIFPKKTSSTGSWGRYGPFPEQTQGILSATQELEDKHSHFRILDLHHNRDHKLPVDWFMDTDHVDSRSAEHLSHQIDSVLSLPPFL